MQKTHKFANDDGVEEISVPVREFECIGASPPFDHPHIFLDMGDSERITCPYCSTVYRLETEQEQAQEETQ